jgi:hypothetical protein
VPLRRRYITVYPSQIVALLPIIPLPFYKFRSLYSLSATVISLLVVDLAEILVTNNTPQIYTHPFTDYNASSYTMTTVSMMIVS